MSLLLTRYGSWDPPAARDPLPRPAPPAMVHHRLPERNDLAGQFWAAARTSGARPPIGVYAGPPDTAVTGDAGAVKPGPMWSGRLHLPALGVEVERRGRRSDGEAVVLLHQPG